VLFVLFVNTIIAGGPDILPILWSDNYFSVLGNESVDISATFETSLLGDNEPALLVEVFNNISGKSKNIKKRN